MPHRKHWVLLRGLARESGHWGEFPSLLQKSFPNSKVTCLDLPGSGVHFKKKAPISISENVEFLNEQLKSEEPVYLVAISLGGMVALEWARKYPDRIAKVFTINSSLASLSPFYKRLIPRNYCDLFLRIPFADNLQREKNILKLVSNRHEDLKNIANNWAFLSTRRPISIQNFLRQLYAAANYKASEILNTPLVTIVSRGDRLVSPECSKKIHEYYKTELYEHEWGGHDLPSDDPEWLIDTLLKCS